MLALAPRRVPAPSPVDREFGEWRRVDPRTRVAPIHGLERHVAEDGEQRAERQRRLIEEAIADSPLLFARAACEGLDPRRLVFAIEQAHFDPAGIADFASTMRRAEARLEVEEIGALEAGSVVLVEMVVLTNPRDEAFVLSNEGLDKLAQGLTNGILAALKKR